jgi:hypothetical protein
MRVVRYSAWLTSLHRVARSGDARVFDRERAFVSASKDGRRTSLRALVCERRGLWTLPRPWRSGTSQAARISSGRCRVWLDPLPHRRLNRPRRTRFACSCASRVLFTVPTGLNYDQYFLFCSRSNPRAIVGLARHARAGDLLTEVRGRRRSSCWNARRRSAEVDAPRVRIGASFAPAQRAARLGGMEVVLIGRFEGVPTSETRGLPDGPLQSGVRRTQRLNHVRTASASRRSPSRELASGDVTSMRASIFWRARIASCSRKPRFTSAPCTRSKVRRFA